MSKKKQGIEQILVDAIHNGTVEQAQTIQRFVNALVNAKTGTTPAAATAPKTTRARATKSETPASSTVSISNAA